MPIQYSCPNPECKKTHVFYTFRELYMSFMAGGVAGAVLTILIQVIL